MATVEELLVQIKTVFDPTGVNQAKQSLQSLSTEQQTANRLLQRLMSQQAATLENYKRAVGGVTQLGGTTPTLGPEAFGIQAGGGETAGKVTQTALSVRQLSLAFLGASSAGTIIHHVLQQVVDVTMKAAAAERQHSAAMASTIPMYGSYTGEIKNLAGAMNTADQSSAKLMGTLGKLIGPTATSAANAENSIFKWLNDVLDETAKKLNDPVWSKVAAIAQVAAAGAGVVIPGLNPVQQLQATNEAQRADREMLRLRQLNATENTPPVLSDKDRTDLQARLNWQDQITAAATALNDAQNVQIGLQHQAVNLSAQEAAIRLSMLPTQERLAALQRDATENQLRARQAALPASEALEDVQYMEQRLRLQLQARGLLSPEERAGARRELRQLARAEPRVALGALDASRGVALAGRVAERADIEQQLFQITQERTLAQLNAAQEANGWLRQIAEAREQGIQIQINLTGEGFMRDVETQITSVFHTARMQAENTAAQQLAGGG